MGIGTETRLRSVKHTPQMIQLWFCLKRGAHADVGVVGWSAQVGPNAQQEQRRNQAGTKGAASISSAARPAATMSTQASIWGRLARETESAL
jgi:hypothetical protein